MVVAALKQIDPKYPVVSPERVAELKAMRDALEQPGPWHLAGAEQLGAGLEGGLEECVLVNPGFRERREHDLAAALG